jgi:hypothetical protein
MKDKLNEKELKLIDTKLECLSLAVSAAVVREPKTVPVIELAKVYYDWVVSNN